MVKTTALVAICTHNPELDKLDKVLSSIFSNVVPKRVLIVDNASTNGIPFKLAKKFKTEYVLENRLGNSFARHKAIEFAKSNELLIFVDDDNYISDTYIETALRLSHMHPDWGAFGGKQLPIENLHVKRKFRSLLPYVGIRSLGNEKKDSMATPFWSELEPIGAGMCISPDLIDKLKSLLENNFSYYSLGRKGAGLLSGEDSFIARTAHLYSLKWGYSPELQLTHDIKAKRLTTKYMIQLMHSYGLSDVSLDTAIGNFDHFPYPSSFWKALQSWFYTTVSHKSGWIIGFRHLGQYRALKSFQSKPK